MPTASRSAWERVGPMLAARRAQISPRYANRQAFADERGVRWRTLHDAEMAKRANFKAVTLRAFEAAYMLVPGSLDRTLAGGPLEPVPAAPADRERHPGAVGKVPSDEALALFENPDGTHDVVKALIYDLGRLEGGEKGRKMAADIMRVVNRHRAGEQSRNEDTA